MLFQMKHCMNSFDNSLEKIESNPFLLLRALLTCLSVPPKHRGHSQDNRLILNLKHQQLVEKRIFYKSALFEDRLHICSLTYEN